MSEFWQFSCPTKIIFGNGISKDFSAELFTLGIKRVLVVSDQGIEKRGLLSPVVEGMLSAGVEISGPFVDVPSNSSVDIVKRCADLGIEGEVDGIVAVGGGSPLDTAKAANILITYGGDLVQDYSGAQTIPGPLKPLIAIPTTAGTGSEVTQAAVILDELNNTKLSFYDQHLHPAIALLDPELLLTLPPNLMAATGWDAFTHAVEAFTSLQASIFSDELALPAIRMIKRSFSSAVKEQDNIQARGEMLQAATLAGIAFDQAMVGVVHSMAHAVGGISHAHHGTLNFILLPYGMEYNMSVCIKKYAHLAKVLQVKAGKKSDEALALAGLKAIKKWQKTLALECGLPMKLRNVGVKIKDLPLIAKKACEDGTSFYNPRELVEDEILKTLKKAY